MTRGLPLDLERFEQLLDVHGADLERWPEPLRRGARELLASSSDAQQVWSRAERLAALLDAVPDVVPSAELSARIAALPVRRPQGWAAWWPFGNPLAPLFAWGAAAAFGLFIGSGLVPDLDPGSDVGSGASAEVAAGTSANETPSGAAVQRGTEDSAGRDSAGLDAASNDSGSDEAEDWSELELALGLGLDWEDEP
ncbi:MAG: hypothetical protein ABI895_09200 [Deltaproteobacteria bacterium]